jgi:nicotinate phosphoribosyltransferase
LSRQVRRILDEAGLNYVNILASGGLDEYEIETLVKGGAPIDGFGVGTRVGVSADAPWSDMAYKLVAYDGRPVMKLSVEKISQPGPRQVFRFSDDAGRFVRDAITCGDETSPAGEPLLVTVLSDGRRTAPSPALNELRGVLARDLGRLDDPHKGLYNPPHYPVEISNRLLRLTEQVRSTIEISQGRESPGPEDPGDGPEDRAAE